MSTIAPAAAQSIAARLAERGIVALDAPVSGGEVGAKEAGRMRLEGKEYVVKDGDIMHFRFAN